VLALGLLRPRLALPSLVAVGLVLALLVAVKVPADQRIVVANNSFMRASNQVFAEMVRGQQGEAANQQRCRLFGEVKHDMSIFYNQTIRRTANLAFEHYWHVPFCASR
jgi:hypothetical protein